MFPDEDNKPIDNPSLHDGRLRSFPHERGNWSTLVYIPCTDASKYDFVKVGFS
jgi:hypothetical protein